MSTIIKFRPFAAKCRQHSPSIISALVNDAPWWAHEPWSSSNSTSRNLEGGNSFAELVDNDNEWKLSYDMPGIKAKDLSVTNDGSNVQISATRHFAALNGDSKTVKKSRIFKSFAVNPNTVDFSQLKANLSDGVLVISAPKKATNYVTEIPITTDSHVESNLEEEFENVTIADTTIANADKSDDDISKK